MRRCPGTAFVAFDGDVFRFSSMRYPFKTIQTLTLNDPIRFADPWGHGDNAAYGNVSSYHKSICVERSRGGNQSYLVLVH